MPNFNNTYIKLPNNFYSILNPVPVQKPELILFNKILAKDLGIENFTNEELANYFSGNKIIKGSEPIAIAYAGHQYGHFVSQLGDGRAILLGEILDKNNQRFDIQLKGSGQTPYSRSGDGRAGIGPMIREYIVSEAMNAFKIPTTRSLAVVKTGEMIQRETALDGAVLTRVAQSHIRVGTFEYFAARRDLDSIKILADYSIQRHFPDLKTTPNIYQNFIMEVAKRQAELIAKWMGVGFIHGVMNTDNMLISGETIDFGPCAFLDEYLANKTFSSIDRHGRYSFSNQANIALWNILNLNYCLSALTVNDEPAFNEFTKRLENYFSEIYSKNYWKIMLEKIGIEKNTNREDQSLLKNLLEIMSKDSLDFTITFRYLSETLTSKSEHLEPFIEHSESLQSWILQWKNRLKEEKKTFEEITKQM